MKLKTTTITFGVSSHYFKTSVSINFEHQTSKDFSKGLKLAKKLYMKALAQELSLKKKFDNMELDEIEDYVKRKIENGG